MVAGFGGFTISNTALAWLLTLHLTLSALIVGGAWHEQIVQLPLLRRVAPERFAAFMELHLRRLTWLLAPLMIVTLAAGMVLLEFRYNGLVISVQMMAWAVTGSFVLPLYRRLSEGYKEEVFTRLIRWNAVRVALWCLHLLFAFVMAWVGARN